MFTRQLHLTSRATAIALALLIALLTIVIAAYSPIPTIDEQYGETSLRFAADRAWALFPGDCVTIRWRAEGIEALHVEERGEIGWGEKAFCPQLNDTAARFAVRSPDGLYREFVLRVHFLPDLLLYLAGFSGVVGSLGLAVYFFWVKSLDRAWNLRWLIVAGALLVVTGTAARLAPADPLVIDYADEQVALRFWAKKSSLLFPRECLTAHWSVLGAETVSFNGDPGYAIEDNHSQGRFCKEFAGLPTLTLQHPDGATSSHSLPARIILPGARDEAAFVGFQTLGLALAGLVFTPLLVAAARDAWRLRKWQDLCALAGFFALVLLLYLPFGFDGAGHWELWTNNAAIQGLDDVKHRGEEVSRFFAIMPHILSILLDSDSYIGFNLVHFALHFGKLAVLYLILRQLGARCLVAFLMAILFFAYPVNSGLMSLRSLPLNHAVFWLLVGLCLLLDWLRNPRRHSLLGVLLALLYNAASNETAYALILVLPALWWLRGQYSRRLKLSATILWYLSPIFKAGWLLLLNLTGRPNYAGGLGSGGSLFANPAEALRSVYQQTFFDGWREAVASLADNHWLLPTLLGLVLVAGLALYLARQASPPQPPSWRQIGAVLLGGLLLIIPAVGVLMWFSAYQNDTWRMFFYVPFGAAVAVFCLLLLLTAKLKDGRRRDYALIALCLLLLLPSLARFFVQHAETIAAADRKARIMHEIVSLVPAPHAQTQLLVMTSMSWPTMQERGIWELAAGAMFDSALWLIYEDDAPDGATFCLSQSRCGRIASDDMLLVATDRAAALQKTLLLHVDDDLQVSLVDDPAAYLGWELDVEYDPSRLYAADAPLPHRANSLLASALRRQ